MDYYAKYKTKGAKVAESGYPDIMIFSNTQKASSP